ncbi:hypothetical protein ACFVVP_10185 [Streptomyces sp. NPDC058128]
MSTKARSELRVEVPADWPFAQRWAGRPFVSAPEPIAVGPS